MKRPVVSTPPPGASAITMRMVFDGYAAAAEPCACAPPAVHTPVARQSIAPMRAATDFTIRPPHLYPFSRRRLRPALFASIAIRAIAGPLAQFARIVQPWTLPWRRGRHAIRMGQRSISVKQKIERLEVFGVDMPLKGTFTSGGI